MTTTDVAKGPIEVGPPVEPVEQNPTVNQTGSQATATATDTSPDCTAGCPEDPPASETTETAEPIAAQ